MAQLLVQDLDSLLDLLRVDLYDLALVIDTGLEFKQEKESLPHVLAYLLIWTLQLQLLNIKIFSEREIAIEVDERLDSKLDSLEDSFERLIRVFRVELKVQKQTHRFDFVLIALIQSQEVLIDFVV